MHLLIRFALLLALAWSCATARAATPWLPAQGPYWNPSEHGIYYHVSVGPTGFVFVGVTLFGADGAPTSLVMQGPFEPTALDEWRASGVTGRLHSPLYRMDGGACFGCDPPAARVARTVPSEFGDAEIEFRNDGRAVFRHAGRATPIQHYPLFTSTSSLPRNRLGGRWQIHYSGDTEAGPQEIDAVVEIGRTTGVRGTPGGAPTSGVGDFRADEALSIECVDCRRGQTLIPLPNVLAAKDDGTLRLYSTGCVRIVCIQTLTAVVHERDGTLFARSVGESGRAYEITLQRLGDRCGPRFDDCYVSPSQTLVPWTPPAGLWWDASNDGVYYHVGVGPDGFLFVAITLFERSGDPTFLVMQGQFEPAALSTWALRNETGRLRSPLYRMSGGQALDGAYRNPVIAPSELGDAEIVFRSGGHAELRRSGATTALSTYPLYADAAGLPANRLQGRWVAFWRRDTVSSSSGIVDLVPTGDAQRLRVHCTDCDYRTAAALGPRAEIAVESDPWPLFKLEGYSSSATQPAFEFHERDGVLYGRKSRAELSGVGVELQPVLNAELILARLRPAEK
jgi:hypothetical protein